MTNTSWIIIGLISVSLIIVIGIFLYQNSKNAAEEISKQKLAVIQASLAGTLGQGYQKAGLGGWISNILGSDSVTALAGGFGSSVGAKS